MVITSMNMFEFSEKNNREMGVLIDRNLDKELFDKAVNETLSIVQSSESIALRRANRSFSQEKNGSPKTQSKYKKVIRGYCIRCEARIAYDSNKPYCGECYSVWAQFENADYLENVCHRCGEYQQSSMDRPQCYGCYTEQQKELAG
jgi:hypothetical protein